MTTPGLVPPAFAVVGHPNKGKSSIVATLARDDSVEIRAEPGTTKRAHRYPMRVDDEVLYVLIDTPGFERPKAALDWMRKHETTAAKHPEVVRQFVAAHRGDPRFAHETELLRPVMEGAGILYVVDGSVPYGPEYEAEMEILRWTGQPSLALINPIGAANHIDEWEAALSQYFRVVRVFNAVTAEFDKRLELLRAFAQLRETWHAPLGRAVEVLRADRERRRRRAARLIADLLVDMLTLSVSRGIGADEEPGRYREELERQYRERLRDLERVERDAVQEVYEHFSLERREEETPTHPDAEEDLFSERAWRVFGLSRRDFVMMFAGTGATAGIALDIAAGGFTLGAATALGAFGGVVGGVMGYLSAQKLAQVKVLDLSAGRKELRYGPSRNPNLPFVALGRARLHHLLVAGRTHAQRGELHVAGEDLHLSDSERKQLQRSFSAVQKRPEDAGVAGSAREELARFIEGLLAQDEKR